MIDPGVLVYKAQGCSGAETDDEMDDVIMMQDRWRKDDRKDRSRSRPRRKEQPRREDERR